MYVCIHVGLQCVWMDSRVCVCVFLSATRLVSAILEAHYRDENMNDNFC